MNKFKDIVKKDNNIICCYLYGSRVYGTNNEESDYDFIAVIKDKEVQSSLSEHGDITYYTEGEFKELIEKHEISILECLSLNEEFVIKNEMDFEFNLDKQVLRNSISSKASNSWVKCKKKFLVEEDYSPYIGKKSAFHSLRILDFGKQIADNGKITNFSSVNELLVDIMGLNSWEEIESKYKQIYNGMSSEFKKSAPKEVVINKPKMG